MPIPTNYNHIKDKTHNDGDDDIKLLDLLSSYSMNSNDVDLNSSSVNELKDVFTTNGAKDNDENDEERNESMLS